MNVKNFTEYFVDLIEYPDEILTVNEGAWVVLHYKCDYIDKEDSDMSFDNFTEEFAGAIEVSKEILTDDFNMANDAAWDSLAFITTMALVDTYFNVVIDAETLATINTFGELKELISRQAA